MEDLLLQFINHYRREVKLNKSVELMPDKAIVNSYMNTIGLASEKFECRMESWQDGPCEIQCRECEFNEAFRKL